MTYFSLQQASIIADRYKIGRLLGVGGMGEVYEAQHLVTGRPVALKRIPAAVIMASEHAEKRVLREAAAAGALRHPGIVQVLDAGWTADGDVFLVFELLLGNNLEQALQRCRLRPLDMIRVSICLLEALGAVHDAGWIHRDVKPSNVFLAREQNDIRVKLLDFGIAVQIDSMEDEQVVGTLEYMSPEQALGRPLDRRTDLWAVGIVLYRALVGRLPWQSLHPTGVLRSLISGDVGSVRQARPDLPVDLAAIVHRALALEPERRFDSAEEFISALLAVDEASIAALNPPPAQQSTLSSTVVDGNDK